MVEKVDRLTGGLVDVGGVFLAELHQRRQGNARGDELHTGCDRIEVVGGGDPLGSAFDRRGPAGRVTAATRPSSAGSSSPDRKGWMTVNVNPRCWTSRLRRSRSRWASPY